MEIQTQLNHKLQSMIQNNIQNMNEMRDSSSDNISPSNEFESESESFNRSYFNSSVVNNKIGNHQKQKIEMIEEKKVEFEMQIDQVVVVKNGFILNDRNRMIFYNTQINRFMFLEDIHNGIIKSMFYVMSKDQNYIMSQS